MEEQPVAFAMTHAVAEHLGHDLDVRGPRRSPAHAPENSKSGWFELAALDRRALDGGGIRLLDFLRELPVLGVCVHDLFQRHHDERFVALHAGADVCADRRSPCSPKERPACGTVCPLSPVVGLVTKVSGFSVASSMTAGADARVRADEGALVALDAVLGAATWAP